MNHSLSFSFFIICISAPIFAMEQKSPSVPPADMFAAEQKSPTASHKKDFMLPLLSQEEQDLLAAEYEKNSTSEDPLALRTAYFAIVSKLAHTELSKRDVGIEKGATSLYETIGKAYPDESTRNNDFLYGMPLAMQKPATDEKHPFRQFYRPVQAARIALASNALKQSECQATAESASREENVLQEQIALLEKQREIVRAKKMGQLRELTMIVQANKTLIAQTMCYAVQLQEERDTLLRKIETAIDSYLELKNKQKAATVEHEEKNLRNQIEVTEKTITDAIEKLWYCVHYLQRIQSTDGSVGAFEEIKWKLGSIDASQLGITNYPTYLDAKNK